MKVGDLVNRKNTISSPSRLGIITRDLKCDRYMVLFFDDNSHYNMDKRLLEVINESR